MEVRVYVLMMRFVCLLLRPFSMCRSTSIGLCRRLATLAEQYSTVVDMEIDHFSSPPQTISNPYHHITPHFTVSSHTTFPSSKHHFWLIYTPKIGSRRSPTYLATARMDTTATLDQHHYRPTTPYEDMRYQVSIHSYTINMIQSYHRITQLGQGKQKNFRARCRSPMT
jgi:hypothetical protein